jgi:hypothetical protein
MELGGVMQGQAWWNQQVCEVHAGAAWWPTTTAEDIPGEWWVLIHCLGMIEGRAGQWHEGRWDVWYGLLGHNMVLQRGACLQCVAALLQC